MEILKKGQIPGDKIHEGSCHLCETRVRFKQSEGKVTYDQRDGNFVTVICPICNGPIHVNI